MFEVCAWFPLDRNSIVKLCDPSKFELIAPRFARIYNKNLLGCKSKPVSVRVLFSIVMNLSTISPELLEWYDFTMLLQSDGN